MGIAVAGVVPLVAEGGVSKVPFYVAAGLLVGWALLLALIGLRSPEFPRSFTLGRGALAVSALLVVGAMGTAVSTASRPSTVHESPNASKARGSTSPAPTGTGTQATTAAPATSTVSLAADKSGQLKFDTDSLRAQPGKVTAHFVNASPVAHNFTIQQHGKTVAATRTFTKGTASVSVTLKPGVYTFLCTVDSHAQAGMKGTLTIR